MPKETVYRCNNDCPINKKCFILKTRGPINESITVLVKCVAHKKDIPVVIGGKPP